MRSQILKISIVTIIFFSAGLSLITPNVHAAGGEFPGNCSGGIPSGCTDYEIDAECVREKFIRPNTICCPNKCVGEPTTVSDSVFSSFQIFGTSFQLSLGNPQTIPTLVNLALTTVLGIVSIFVLFRAIYVAAFVRTSTNDPAKIQAVNKELTNLMIGFALAWGAIFIVQAVANVLGLGSLNNLTLTGVEGAYVITIT